MSKEACDVLFSKWKIKYDVEMDASQSKKDTRRQCVFDLFCALKEAKCTEDEALEYVGLVKKYIMPDNSFFENAYKKVKPKQSKADFTSYLKKKIVSLPQEAYLQYFPMNVEGAEIKAVLPPQEKEDDDKWEVARFYQISSAMGVTPEEPWYYKFKDGTPKLTPDGLPRKTMGDHIKKKN